MIKHLTTQKHSSLMNYKVISSCLRIVELCAVLSVAYYWQYHWTDVGNYNFFFRNYEIVNSFQVQFPFSPTKAIFHQAPFRIDLNILQMALEHHLNDHYFWEQSGKWKREKKRNSSNVNLNSVICLWKEWKRYDII